MRFYEDSDRPARWFHQACFEAVVRSRRSVRRFRKDRVPRADVQQMVALATSACSPRNAQMWRFVAIDDPARLASMRTAVDRCFSELAEWPCLVNQQQRLRAARGHALFFASAPLCIAVCALPFASEMDELLELADLERDECDRLRQRPDLQAVGAAIQLLTLSAHSMGYGACWMSAPIVAARCLESILGIEPPAQLVALVPIGRPSGEPRRAKRLPTDVVLRFV